MPRAKIICRREETSATRSLLNTAKVIAGDPVMLRLKELEALEAIAGKVERLTVYNGTAGCSTIWSSSATADRGVSKPRAAMATWRPLPRMALGPRSTWRWLRSIVGEHWGVEPELSQALPIDGHRLAHRRRKP